MLLPALLAAERHPGVPVHAEAQLGAVHGAVSVARLELDARRHQLLERDRRVAEANGVLNLKWSYCDRVSFLVVFWFHYVI